MKKTTLILVLMMPLLLFQFCQKDENTPGDNSVAGYQASVTDVNVTLVDFIGEAQKFESTDVTTLPIDDVKPFMDAYILAGEQFVAALEEVIAIQESNKKSYHKNYADGPECSMIDFVPGDGSGLSLGLAKAVGDLIAETKGEVADIQNKWESGEIDDNVYYAAMNELKIKKPLKAVSIGFGAIMGTGAAIIVGAATAPLSLSALATVGIVTATGAVVGSTVTWIAHWYSSNKNGDPAYYMLTGKSEPGQSLPINIIGDNATIIVSPDGYAPVSINNFELPATGINKIIEVEGVKLEDADMSGSTMVCFIEEEMIGGNCDEVQFVTAGPNPPDPGPGVGVTVTATLIPIAPDCNISFTIVGTDGYSNSATALSDANGNASFYIPGGEEGVVDVVTITSSNGKTYTVTYVF